MMTAVDFIRVEVGRLHTMLDGTLSEISAEQLHTVPAGNPCANTLAWGLFHCVRTEDNIVRFVLQDRRPPVWTEGGYAERLGLPPVAQGTGMSTADAQALRLKDIDLFREYMQQVWKSTKDLFATAAPGFFDKSVTIKPLGEMPAFRAIGQVVVSHGLMHVGQMELIRTLVGASPVIGV
jgi:DinB superfamily